MGAAAATGARTIFVCSCEDSFAPDARAIGRGCRGAEVKTARQLCRAEQGILAAALGAGAVTVGCMQEERLFRELAAEAGHATPLDVADIRGLAGWSEQGAQAAPKMAALLAAAAVPMPPVPLVPLESKGAVLILGRDAAAIDAGAALAAKLDVTVLLHRPDDVPPPRTTVFPVAKGVIRTAKGHLGAFDLVVDDFALPAPSSRAALVFPRGRDGALSRADIVLDISGRPPLFPAPHKRPGYLRADPSDPLGVQRAIMAAGDLIGTFDKPRFVAVESGLCAHTRNRRTGCTRCLEVCPTGAIAPAGDHVAVDANICAGCGACAALCPTGAITYALPPAEPLLKRLRALMTAYVAAGGDRAVLLLHDGGHGEPLLDALARHGPGLPARVIPMRVNEPTQLDLALVAGAFAYGAAELRVLLTARPREDLEPLERVLGYADAILVGLGLGGGRAAMLAADDPVLLAETLADLPGRDGVAAPSAFLPMGQGPALARAALRELHRVCTAAEGVVIPLPPRAPFGSLAVDTANCTLCLSCVSVCPTGALSDDPDRPVLKFTEDACVQCGLCAATCPEKVIALDPRLSFAAEARAPRVLKQEEPFPCTRCGTPFGTRSSIERVAAKLAGKHWMFAQGGPARATLFMCGDCRAIAATEASLDPHAGPARPRTVMPEDY
jgi:ferredoxin